MRGTNIHSDMGQQYVGCAADFSNWADKLLLVNSRLAS